MKHEFGASQLQGSCKWNSGGVVVVCGYVPRRICDGDNSCGVTGRGREVLVGTVMKSKCQCLATLS